MSAPLFFTFSMTLTMNHFYMLSKMSMKETVVESEISFSADNNFQDSEAAKVSGLNYEIKLCF